MTARVLIVDDSFTVRMDLRATFVDAGFDVTLCATLAEGRVALAHEPYALVVLDVVLPDGDGVDLLQEIKGPGGATPTPAVMLLTSEAVVRDRIRGWSIGADDYIGKPYDRGYVVARARELVHGHSANTSAIQTRAVLVVENSPVYGAVLRAMLEEAGYSARLATTGEEGLRIALALRPSAAIVSARLPGIDGATVVKRMRLDAALRSMPALLLTTSADVSEELRALEAGVDAFVRRGADPGLILARLAPLVRGGADGLHPQPSPSALGPKRILVVDPDPSFPNALAAQLEGEGYEVAVATSGEAALELLTVQPFDCLLLEVHLPGRAGLDICREIKEMPTRRDTPVVIVTALEEQETMISCMNAGADDFVSKSSGLDVIRARVRALLRRKQFEDERRQIQEKELRQQLHAAEAHAAWDLAEARAALLADLREKHDELRRINELLEVARDQAERESHSKSRFLASMSHELRTPLNAIIGFSELLEQELFGPLNDRQMQYIGHVHSSGRHLLSLINDVLDLSKIAAGRIELKREHIDPGAIAEAAIGIVRPLALKQGVQLDADIDAALPMLHADAIRLRQVLYNLLSNAIKFTRAGGRVRLRAWASEEHLYLAVTDTGIGIRVEDLPRLFREFEQIESDASGKPEGTGLGLTLSQRLVELHGGDISVASEVDVGSTFTVSLPLQISGFELMPTVESGTGPLVLIVEDDAKAADLIAGHLRVSGLSVAWARTGEEALEIVSQTRPVAITLDILLPGLDGWELLAQLRADPAIQSIPIIVVTVVDEATRGLALGASDYLVKPVDRETILRSLEAVGVPIERGLHVLLLGAASSELARVEANLRATGHRVKRSIEPAIAAGELDDIDLVIADLSGEPREVRRLLALLHPSVVTKPVLTLSRPDGPPAPFPVSLERPYALDADRLAAAVRAAVLHGQEPTVVDAPTPLPSRQKLVAHLRGALIRAERGIRLVVVVAARLSTVGNVDGFDMRAVGPKLRSGDFLAMPEEDVVVLVVEGVPKRATQSIEARLSRIVTEVCGQPPIQIATALFPSDATRAERLLSTVLRRLTTEVNE